MTSKRLFAYTSILFLVPICTGLVFISQSNVSFLSAEVNQNSSEYSLTINDYDGGSEQTYYTSLGNPLIFEYHFCTPSEDGLAYVTSSSYIVCQTPVHGITSLLVTADQHAKDTYVRFTIVKPSGSTSSILSTPNTETTVDIPSTGFAVYFEGSAFVATGITFTYTCL